MSDAARTNAQLIARKTFMGGVTALCLAFIVLSAVDYAVLRYRMAKFGAASVTAGATYFYAAPMKGDKVHVFTDQPQTEICVRSIFPWLGYDPCWYVNRHAIKLSS